MQENIEYVQKGLRVLLAALSSYIMQRLRRIFKDRWWNEVLRVLKDPPELPWSGEDVELADSLDIANCLRVIDRLWFEAFNNDLSLTCRSWAKELMGVRNLVAHKGQQDLDQHVAERALDTMVLLCNEIDRDSADEIREYYEEVRARAGDASGPEYVEYLGLRQPESESARGALQEGSLLQVGPPVVEKTAITRKVTFGGRTVLYPVYRVRLDALYYNDQNDRIATWITRYEAENGAGSLNGMDISIYNSVIENFIVDSNPDSIRKTQKNIALVGQREPGVALADGRIVDGNRRFTCLRRMQRVTPEPLYFETVLLDMDIEADRKQIKLLELAIQHGEEKKVDYDQIDYAIGTYRDIEETGLLTVEEYAASANEKPADVRLRLAIAGLIIEFLNAVGIPGQYHAARDYQVYDLFTQIQGLLRQLDDSEREQIKTIAFNNAVFGAERDQRKFIRDIKALVRTGNYKPYFAEQMTINERIREELAKTEIRGKEDLDRFALEHRRLADDLMNSLERAMQRSRSAQLKNKPAESVGKCITQMMDVDPRLFSRLEPDEKDALRSELDELMKLVESFRQQL